MAFYFAADRTLGKLAKWLRILGFDTTFEIEIPAELFYEIFGKRSDRAHPNRDN